MGDYRKNYYHHIYDHELEDAITSIKEVTNSNHPQFLAVKLIEGDSTFDQFHNDDTKKIIPSLFPNLFETKL